VLLALWIATGSALAAGVRLKLAGPSGVTLSHNQRYTVKASGRASSKANTLFAYEGGQVRGGTAAIVCYATESAEFARYRPAPGIHVFLHPRHVSGRFSVKWTNFAAVHVGPRSFCAYLANASGTKTYAQASLHWTNQ
jgi:hypothetical protein